MAKAGELPVASVDHRGELHEERADHRRPVATDREAGGPHQGDQKADHGNLRGRDPCAREPRRDRHGQPPVEMRRDIPVRARVCVRLSRREGDGGSVRGPHGAALPTLLEGERGECKLGAPRGRHSAPRSPRRERQQESHDRGAGRSRGGRLRQPPQLIDEVAGRLPPAVRILRQALRHQAVERRRRRLHGRQLRGNGVQDRPDQAGLTRALKRLPPGDHLVDHRPEGKHVRPSVDVPSVQLLRGHVLQRAEDRPLAGQRLTLGDLSREALHPHPARGLELRQPEVQELGPRLGQHDVPRLEVAVHDPLPMRLVQRIRDGDRHLERLLQWQRTILQPLGERLPVEILHDQEVGAAFGADVMEGADVRVVQGRDGLGLPLEPLLQIGVRRDMRGAAP